jgi:hypothetical protein
MACADDAFPPGGAPRADLLYPLFHIDKNDSYNEVHYAAALGPDCRFAAEPVRVFWLRRTEPQRAPKPLTWLEETFVYGVRLLQVGAERVTFALAADDTRSVLLEAFRSAGGCRLKSRLRILGDWAEPSRAYVTIVDSTLPMPKISNIELHGRGEDGRPLCERLTALRAPGAPCNAMR